ncbi:MAG: hypothetical protein LBR68_03725 [Lachnoclostridium sp.]|jgi:hypothetical protein|nr:hypothetical protein [Lachnoclostridium sp.]
MTKKKKQTNSWDTDKNYALVKTTVNTWDPIEASADDLNKKNTLKYLGHKHQLGGNH